MEKLLGEVQTSYFWIMLVLAFFGGLFINYSMKPIDAVMGRVSKKWKDRAEKRWEGLRDEANQLNEDETRLHVRGLCAVYGQRAIWYLIVAITGVAMTFFQLIARNGMQEAIELMLLNNGMALVTGCIATWCLLRALAFDKSVRRMQAALELREEFRQILRQNAEEEAAGSSALNA